MTMPETSTLCTATQGALHLLGQVLEQFESRPGQTQMAQAVAQALDSQRDLLVEAGTGTGKTLAYLLPILAAGKKALISTATKHLQSQIIGQDIAIAMRAAGVQREVTVLKGRANYLCLDRIHALQHSGRLPSVELMAIESVSRHSPTGDRNEVGGVQENDAIWPEVTSTADSCLGSSCSFFDQCFVVKARRRAQAADIVIVNHSLLLADYAIRERFDQGGLLPSVDAIVIDEAHALADIATSFFGTTLSQRRIYFLTRDWRGLLTNDVPHELQDQINGHLNEIDEATTVLFKRLRSLNHQQPVRSQTQLDHQQAALDLDEKLGLTQNLLEHETLAALPHWQKAAESLYALRSELDRTMLQIHGDEPDDLADDFYVRWIEHRQHDSSILAMPLDVGPILQRTLLAEKAVRIFTSATLTAMGSFEHTRQKLGLAADTDTLLVESPFDFKTQALLYVPNNVPEPFAAGRDQAVAETIEQLAILTGGACFALFSSTRAMRDAYERVKPRTAMTCLVQGDAGKEELLERFVREQPAVLFATMGFWQGVDLPQDALRVVVIDKIPFPPPDDPLFAARGQRIEAEGGSSFHQLSVPLAAIALRQGFGRLVRSRRHFGVVTLLDPRVVTKPYGRLLWRSLPNVPRTQDFNLVRAFFVDRLG